MGAVTMTRKYYMGTSAISSDYSYLQTLSEAVQKCKEYLEEHPECSERYVVQVVKVVKRKETPIIVEDVR